MNFFLADVRGGLGPFVSVFLVTAAGWTPAGVGIVLTISGLIGISAHVPVGAFIDAVKAKRALLIAAAGLLSLCALAIQQAPTGPVVFTADVTMAVLGGVFAPAVAAITLGVTPPEALARRFARNVIWDRAGNIFIAALAGAVGWQFGVGAIFYLVPVFAAASAIAILSIPGSAIDYGRARGLAHASGPAVDLWALFTRNRRLLTLGALAAGFHFANGSMITLAGQRLGLEHPGLETALTSTLILVAQFVTVPVAWAAGRAARSWGMKRLLALACLALMLRGLIFAASGDPAIAAGAQILDGVATGVWEVLLPLMLAEFVAGSGRYSASRGFIGLIQGIGGSLSNAAGGIAASAAGYSAAFWMLALFAGVTLALTALLPDDRAQQVRTPPAVS